MPARIKARLKPRDNPAPGELLPPGQEGHTGKRHVRRGRRGTQVIHYRFARSRVAW